MRKRILSLAVLLSIFIANTHICAHALETITIDSLTASDCAEDEGLITISATYTASSGVDYLTFLMTANTDNPPDSSSDIIYINQIANNDGTFQFNVEKAKIKEALGSDDLSEVTLYLKMGGTSVTEASVKSVTYSEASQGDTPPSAEEAKTEISALADGSAEISSIINEYTAQVDSFYTDNVLSAEEAQKLKALINNAKKRCGMLNIRFQITAGTTSSSESADIRFISTVDRLDYKETGFYITINGVKKRISTRYVYTGLIGKNGEAATSYTPDKIFAESKWFSTYSIWGIPNSAFGTPITVQPFVVTKDGTEILGVEKTRTLNNFIR